MPRPDFPRTLLEFADRFPTEEAAIDYLVASRWPDGDFKCPTCAHGTAYAISTRGTRECANCKRQVSPTAGTVMHRSRMPARTWLLAAWLLVTDKRGLSAKQLQRQIGGRYETAYQMLQRLRAAMVAPDRSQLFGLVEVDETLIGAPKRGRPERTPADKAIVLGAVEVRTGKKSFYPARIRLRHIKHYRKELLLGFVTDVVRPGSRVVTDAKVDYEGVAELGYEHGCESTSVGDDPADVLKHFHLAISNLKAWLNGTFHGAVSKKHLQAYLNEFMFRYNRRANLHAAFQRLLGLGMQVRGPEYTQLYASPDDNDAWDHPNR